MNSTDSDLYELVFEQLSGSQARALLLQLCLEDSALPSDEEAIKYTRLGSLRLYEGVVFPNVHVGVVVLEKNIYNVELNFTFQGVESDCRAEAIEALQKFAVEVAHTNDIASFFAGLEPASDQPTRLFTGQDRGPFWPKFT